MTDRFHVSALRPGVSAEADRAILAGTCLQALDGRRIVEQPETLISALDPAGPLRGKHAQLFVVTDEHGADVGRCLAVAHATLPQRGFVALWECSDDEDAQVALLDAARDWLARNGCREVAGPVDLCVGLRGGFASAGSTGECALGPAPTSGIQAWQRAGASVLARSATWSLPLRRRMPRPASAAVAYRTLSGAGLLHTMADMRLLADHAARGLDTWPAPGDALAETVRGLERFVDPRLITVAVDRAGALVGYAVALPDVSDVLRSLDGDWSTRISPSSMRSVTDAVIHSVVSHSDELLDDLIDVAHANVRAAGYRVARHVCVPDGSPWAAALKSRGAAIEAGWVCMKAAASLPPDDPDAASLVRAVSARLEDQLAR